MFTPRSILAAATLAVAACAPRPAAEPRPAAAALADTATILVAATTDVHGRLRGWEYYANAPDTTRGLSRAATIVDSLRAAHPDRVVLVDNGDLLQGNPLTYVAARVAPEMPHPVIAAMNAMGYDAAVLGNHEFNYGVPTLERAVRQADFPFLAANVFTPAGDRAFPAHALVRRGPVTVGIVGATTPGSMVWDRDNLAGRLVVRDIVPAVRDAVAEVRARGADAVVVLLHSGLGEPSSYDTVATGLPSENVAARVAREVPGIDLITYGHSHRQVADTTINGVLLVQPRNWAGSVGVARLTLARDGDDWRVVRRSGSVVPAAGRAESPAVLRATQAAHEATVRWVTTPVGTTPVAWRADSARVADTPIIDFVLEVMRRAAGADLASTAAFSLTAGLDSGAITLAELAALYPYDNTLRAVRISGAQLKDYLEHSARYYGTFGTSEPVIDPEVPGYNFDIVAGADYTIDLSKPVGSRITGLAVRGRPVAPTDSFTLALNNYRQTGGGGFTMLAGAPLVHDGQEEIRQLLVEEVRRRGTLRPSDYFTPNWRIVPPAAAERAYRGRVAGSRVSDARDRAVTLRILSTNDFHGTFEPRADSRGVRRGGAGPLAAAIAAARRECAPPDCVTLLLDGGDQWQGTPVSNLAYGAPVVELYEMLGYAATALGNHEFDWGQDTLRARMREADFAILGANVRYADGRDVEWIPNDTVVQRGPLTVGIIGVSTTSTPETTMPAHVADLRFVDPAPVVDSIARALRARGADAVVVVAHAGAHCENEGSAACRGEIVDLARAITAPVDAIVSGHSHSLVNTVVNGIPIVQARSHGRSLAVLDVPFRPAAGGRWARAGAPAGTAPADVRDVVADSLAAVARVDSVVRAAIERIRPVVDRPVARIAEPLRRTGSQYALGNLIADAQRWAGKADVAIMNNGGIRADLPEGVATYGRLYEVQPFANRLMLFRVTGKDLRAHLEKLVDGEQLRAHVSGARIVYDPSRPAGSRIVRAEVGGAPIRDDREYTLVMSNFLATGGDGLALSSAAREARELGIVDLDALMDYLRSLPQPVRAPAEPRITTTTSGAGA